MEKAIKVDLPKKVKIKSTTLFIRSISTEVKKKFYAKAVELGYTPREYFEELIKKQ